MEVEGSEMAGCRRKSVKENAVIKAQSLIIERIQRTN